MKHRLFLVAVIILLGSIAPIRQAKAASCVILNGQTNATGGFKTVGFYDIIDGHVYQYDFDVLPETDEYASNVPDGSDTGVTGPHTGTESYKGSYPDTPLAISAPSGDTILFTVTDLSCAAPSSQGAVTFFDPGDGRVDGKPGDRLAVWCNTDEDPQNIVVYGIGDQSNGSHGFFLIKVTPEKVEANSESIRTFDAGTGNGTVSIEGDGKGDFYIAWNGGIFHATGQGPFAKTVYCDFD